MIALDSDAFSLVLKGVFHRARKTKANNAEEQKRASRGQAFLTKQIELGEPLMISTVSLAEYLVLFPPEDQAQQLAEIHRMFRVFPLDDRCAMIAARIRQTTLTSKQVNKAYEGRKRLLKLDCLVLAVAVGNGAERLISYDNGLAALARAAYQSKQIVMEFPAVSELQFDPPDQLPKPDEEDG